MSGERRGSWLRIGLGLGLAALILGAGIGWHQARLLSWRAELAQARQAMDAGRFGRAREILSRLSEHWDNEGEVFLLLGECEQLTNHREEALAAWARVPSSSRSFARATRYRASNL